MRGTARFLATLMLFLTLPARTEAHTIITRMSDRQNVSMTELAAAAGGSDLVLIGEVHDNKDHHDLQLDLIRSLYAKKLPLAIGLEMVPASRQQQLNDWTGGRMSEVAMRTVFQESWTNWQLYREIFLFARDNRIPLVALDVPIEIVRKVSQHGFKSLTPQERRDLPPGTSCDLGNPQIAVLRKSFKEIPSHLGNGKVFDYFCEAQTVRNSGMAVNMVHYLQKNPGRRIAVLTGIWHAVKYAIPDQLVRAGSRLSYTVILPETPELSSANSGVGEADFLYDM